MKTKFIYSLSLFLFGFVGATFADSEPRLTITLTDVNNYRDFSVSGMSEERTKGLFQSEFKRFARTEANRSIPEGYRVHLEFTDIDMAGDIQPWRNRNHSDLRYIEAIYPPLLEFNYTVTDADGEVVMEGEKRLRDINYLFSPNMRFRSFTSFRYELSMLSDWMRGELRREIRALSSE